MKSLPPERSISLCDRKFEVQCINSQGAFTASTPVGNDDTSVVVSEPGKARSSTCNRLLALAGPFDANSKGDRSAGFNLLTKAADREGFFLHSGVDFSSRTPITPVICRRGLPLTHLLCRPYIGNRG